MFISLISETGYNMSGKRLILETRYNIRSSSSAAGTLGAETGAAAGTAGAGLFAAGTLSAGTLSAGAPFVSVSSSSAAGAAVSWAS